VLLEEGGVPGLDKVPVYIDSPLGIAATEIFEESSNDYYDEEAMAFKAEGIKFFSFKTLRVAETADESKAINFDKQQKIIISSSGMCDAGRIKHHLKHNLWRTDSTVLFVGYQAVGTLGRSIADGNDKVKIFGEEIQVKSAIEQIEGFSGHADQSGLLEWISHFPTDVARVFVMHGEETVTALYATELQKRGYNGVVPGLFDTFDTQGFVKTQGIVPPVKEVTQSDLGTVLARIRLKIEAADVMRAARMKEELNSLADRWE
jgi:metallo-beta-lactamase family protein